MLYPNKKNLWKLRQNIMFQKKKNKKFEKKESVSAKNISHSLSDPL